MSCALWLDVITLAKASGKTTAPEPSRAIAPDVEGESNVSTRAMASPTSSRLFAASA